MGYDLGVDLGGTSVAAAVTTDSSVEMVPLGERTMTIPAMVFLSDDGTLLAGDAAARRAIGRPDRVGRELKRRLGGPTPVQLGGTPYPPAALLGALLQDVVDRVAETVGSKPDRVLLTHPAHWSPARRKAFTEAIRTAGLPEVRTVTEPEAVAAHYAATGRLAEGDTMAVYDLGGGSFDATVLRRTSDGIELLGLPEGIERLGGSTFDEAILSHVNQATDVPLAGLDRRDPQSVAAVARLRQECVLAKETLTVETAATIPVLLPNRQAEVTLTRPEFEEMIHTSVQTTIGTLLKTLQSAQVEPGELAAVLLVGGSARIPLVAKMITDVLARPAVLDAQPKHPVALGAAILAAAPADTTTETPTAPAAAGRREPEPHGPPPQPAAADAQVPAPRDRRDHPPVAATVGARGAASGSARPTARSGAEPTGVIPPGNPPDAIPISLFEPRTPVGTIIRPDVPAPADPGLFDLPVGARVTAATTMVAPPAAVPDRSLPSFLAGDTTVIPTPGPWPTPEPTRNPSPTARQDTDAEPAPLVRTPDGDVPRNAPPLPPEPAPGGGRPRRRTLAVVIAAALVALLVGAGYLVWNRLPGTPAGAPQAASPAASDGQPAGPGQPGAPAASVPAPKVGATVQAGDTPGFVVVSPDGRQALIANQDAGVVTVLDTATNEVTARIPVTAGPPQYLAYSPDGQRVYVSIWDQARTVAAVGVLDSASNAIVATIPVRTRPYLSAVTPDGQRLYVPNHDSGTISVIDTGTNAVTTEIKVAPNPHWVEMSDDGTRAYVANHESNLVSVIDTTNNSILAEVPVQISPHSLAVHPTRPLVANVNYDSATVTFIDTTIDRVVATIPVGTNPQDITWAPDGRYAYVVNTTDGTISVIDGDSATVTATVPTGTSPTSVAVLPDGSAAYVSNLKDGTLSVLDIAG